MAHSASLVSLGYRRRRDIKNCTLQPANVLYDPFQTASKTSQPPNMKGERIWFFGLEQVNVCSDGLLIEARESSKSPGLYGCVAVRVPDVEHSHIQLLSDLQDANCLYVYGVVERVNYKQRATRMIKPTHLEWVNAGVSVRFGQTDVPIISTEQSLSDVLQGRPPVSPNQLPPNLPTPDEQAPEPQSEPVAPMSNLSAPLQDIPLKVEPSSIQSSALSRSTLPRHHEKQDPPRQWWARGAAWLRKLWPF